MAFKLLNFQEQDKTDTFYKLTQIEKSGSNIKTKIHLQNSKSITFFVTLTLSLFDNRICRPLNKENQLN